MTAASPTLHDRLRELYHGDSPTASRFRWGMVIFDLVTVGIFLFSSFVRDDWWLVPLYLVLAVIIALDYAARFYVADDKWRFVFSWGTLLDAIVFASLVLPAFLENLGFLRSLRAVALLRSRQLRKDLRTHDWFRLNEDVILRSVTLGVFIFIVTSAVYVTQHAINPAIRDYVDAAYFTITTLTTTGFGDITLQGPGGRLLAIAIMIVGVTLFLQLLKALIQPNRVRHECPDCGLLVHDFDAVHCKHCGKVLHIRDEGFV